MAISLVRRLLVVLAALALAAAACGGGGGGSGEDARDDPTDPLTEGPVTAGERRIQFTGAGRVRISGTFTVPAAATTSANATVPGVLFLPDLLVTDRDGSAGAGTAFDRMGDDLARKLSEAGLATFRFERRGTGESKLEPDQRLSLDDIVADGKAALDFMAQRKETSGSKLAVVGYDESGLVALRLAANDDRVSRVVLVSAPGRPLVDVHADDFDAAYGPEAATGLRETVSRIVAGGGVPPLQELRAELRPLLPQQEAAFLTSLYTIDPVAEASRTRVPVLAIAGSRSTGAARVDAERLVQAVAPRGEVFVAENADATLANVLPPPDDDPSDPASPTHDHGAAPPNTLGGRNQAAVDRLTNWLKTGLGTAP